MDAFLGLLSVLALIGVNAFFVAGEFGVVAVDREAVEHDAEDGSSRAQRALRALKTLSFQLSGAQLGITVSSLLLGFIVEGALGETIRPALTALGVPEASSLGIAVTLGLVLATAAQMVLGELVPKNLAIARPLGMAYAISGPLIFVNSLLRPVILFLNGAANWTVRRIGIEPRDELMPVRSLSELDLLIRSSREGGALREDEYSLLSRSISFATKTASDALTPRTALVALRRDQTCADMAAVAVESGHSRFPVVGEDLDDLVGIAHVKDSYRFPFEGRGSIPVTDITRQPMVVPESRNLETLLHEMRRDRQQMAIVADEYGGTAGIATLEDILEEIVGEIEDEYDPSGAGAPEGPPVEGVSVLSGMLHLGEVEEACGLEIPPGPYDTLAGFVLWLLDRIPVQGDHATYRGWEFKVVAMDGYRIDKVLVCAPGEDAGVER